MIQASLKASQVTSEGKEYSIGGYTSIIEDDGSINEIHFLYLIHLSLHD
jgi:hypothetical protein